MRMIGVREARCHDCGNMFRTFPGTIKVRPHKRGYAGAFRYCPGGGKLGDNPTDGLGDEPEGKK